MSGQIEDRIRTALQARAELVTERELRPPRPYGTPPPRRPWVLPIGLAAAVTTVLALSGSVPTQQLAVPDPAGRPATATTPAPTSDPTPSATADTTARGTAARSASPTGSPDRQPSALTKSVTYRGMTINIPERWTLIQHDADPGWACVSSTPGSCELTITRLDSGHHVLHADDPFQTAAGLACREQGPVAQVAAGTLRAGTRTAEYRRYATSCVGGARFEIEQWTFDTVPAAKFHRAVIDPATEAAVVAAVASARFDRRATADLVTDFGVITGYRLDGADVVLEFDRATPVLRGTYPHEWDMVNNSTRTYDYRIADDLRIDQLRLCFDPVDSKTQACDPQMLRQRIDEGDQRTDGGAPVATIPVWFKLDGGRVVAIG